MYPALLNPDNFQVAAAVFWQVDAILFFLPACFEIIFTRTIENLCLVPTVCLKMIDFFGTKYVQVGGDVDYMQTQW